MNSCIKNIHHRIYNKKLWQECQNLLETDEWMRFVIVVDISAKLNISETNFIKTETTGLYIVSVLIESYFRDWLDVSQNKHILCYTY